MCMPHIGVPSQSFAPALVANEMQRVQSYIEKHQSWGRLDPLATRIEQHVSPSPSPKPDQISNRCHQLRWILEDSVGPNRSPARSCFVYRDAVLSTDVVALAGKKSLRIIVLKCIPNRGD